MIPRIRTRWAAAILLLAVTGCAAGSRAGQPLDAMSLPDRVACEDFARAAAGSAAVPRVDLPITEGSGGRS